MPRLRVTRIDIATSCIAWLRPRWRMQHEHVSQAPHPIGQARGHHARPWLPALECSPLSDRIALSRDKGKLTEGNPQLWYTWHSASGYRNLASCLHSVLTRRPIAATC